MDSDSMTTLMFGDIEVLRFNADSGKVEIISELYIPYGMKGVVIDNVNNRYANNNIAVRNNSTIVRWLARRVLTLSRSNANKIYDLFNFDRADDEYTRYDIAMVCRAVSVLDKYWLKFEDDSDDISWSSVNIKNVHLNEVVANVALHGDSLTLSGSYNTPELTTNGLFAKAWRRRPDGSLWLYKCGINGNVESVIEVEVSRVLDRCNVDHVKYLEGYDRGKYVCMCKCMSTDRYSILPASEFKFYCKKRGLDFESEVLKIDPAGYYKMHIVDYLISNNDRHINNWGFYFDNKTMKLVSLHPLFDHNNAFCLDLMNDKDVKYRCTQRPMRKDAITAMSKVDFHFTSDIDTDDFDWLEHYDSFMERAKELGVKTIPSVGEGILNAANIMRGN